MVRKTNHKVGGDALLYDEFPHRMGISISITLIVDVVITIEIKAFFHKKGACVAPLLCADQMRNMPT
jgi:hypothetical protein